MASFGNLIWFVLGGAIWALTWLLIAGVFAITIIGLPIARACLEFAKLSAFPFGKEIIRDTELLGKNNVSGLIKTANTILGIIWFPFGLILTISYFALALACFVSIIGIPFGIAYVRIGKFVLFPLGARVVSKKEAYAIAAANETAKRMNTGVQDGTSGNVTASNVQQNSAFAFSKETGIATVIGVLVCFLLFRFVRIPSQFFNGWVLAQSIIGAVAVIFGGIAGGIIGFFGVTLSNLTFLIRNGFYPDSIVYMVIDGIRLGLFGLLAGIICQKFVLGKKENGVLKNVIFVFLITFVLQSLIWIIVLFIQFIKDVISTSRVMSLLSLRGIFRISFRRMEYFLLEDILLGLITGILTGILCSLAAFIYLKLRAKKETSPVEETKQPEQNTTQDNEA